MPDDFFSIWIVRLLHQTGDLSVDRAKDIYDLFGDAIELCILDEESFLQADRQIQRVCKFLIHHHTEPGEIFIKIYRLDHLTRQKKSDRGSFQ